MDSKLKQCIEYVEEQDFLDAYIESTDTGYIAQVCCLDFLSQRFDLNIDPYPLQEKLREYAERKHLVEIGLGLASLDLPVLLLTEIYNNSVDFEEHRVPLFISWEILKTIKHSPKTVVCERGDHEYKDMRTMLHDLAKQGKIGMSKGDEVTLDFASLYPNLSGPITQAYLRGMDDHREMLKERMVLDLELTEEEQKIADEWEEHKLAQRRTALKAAISPLYGMWRGM